MRLWPKLGMPHFCGGSILWSVAFTRAECGSCAVIFLKGRAFWQTLGGSSGCQRFRNFWSLDLFCGGREPTWRQASLAASGQRDLRQFEFSDPPNSMWEFLCASIQWCSAARDIKVSILKWIFNPNISGFWQLLQQYQISCDFPFSFQVLKKGTPLWSWWYTVRGALSLFFHQQTTDRWKYFKLLKNQVNNN